MHGRASTSTWSVMYFLRRFLSLKKGSRARRSWKFRDFLFVALELNDSCKLGITGLTGKVVLQPRVIFSGEIDLVFRLYLGGIMAVKPMVLL